MIKRKIADVGYAVSYDDLFDGITVGIPRCVRIILIIRHGARAEDVQRTLTVQHPGQIFPTGAVLLDCAEGTAVFFRIALRCGAAETVNYCTVINSITIVINRALRIQNSDACKAVARIKRSLADTLQLAVITEVYACKAVAIRKRRTADGCQLAVFTKSHTCKAVAIRKRRTADGCQLAVFTKSHTCKAVAIIKCITADACHACRNCDACKAVAIRKRLLVDALQLAVVSEIYTCKAVAIIKRISADGCHAVRNGNTCKALTMYKCIITDAGHAVADNHFFDGITAGIPRNIRVTCIIGHCTCAVYNQCSLAVQCPLHVFPTGTGINKRNESTVVFARITFCRGAAEADNLSSGINRCGTVINITIRIQNSDVHKAVAIRKRLLVDACHTCRDVDACKAVARRKRIIADALQLAVVAEVHTCKAVAIIKRRIADACHTCRNCDACKAVARIKRFTADAFQLAVVSEIYIYKAVAIIKRRTADSCHACRDGITCSCCVADGILNECCFVLVEQNAAFIAAVIFIIRINRDACKAVAIIKRRTADSCHAVRDGDACKAVAIRKCMIPDACHACRNSDACKAVAVFKRISADTCHTCRNRITCSCITDRVLNECCFVLVEQNAAFIAAVIFIIRINRDACKVIAIKKYIITNACYTFRNVDTCKGGAEIKRTIRNTCYSVRNGNTCKALTKHKCIITDAGHAVADNHFFDGITAGIPRNIRVTCIIGHCTCAVYNQCSLAVQCPLHVFPTGTGINKRNESTVVFARITFCRGAAEADNLSSGINRCGTVINITIRIQNSDVHKAVAITKRKIADACHTCRNRITCSCITDRVLNECCFVLVEQNAAFIAAVISIIRINRDACKAVARIKRSLADTLQLAVITEVYACKAVARSKRIIADACHTIRNGDTFQIAAFKKRPPADVCYSVFDDHIFDGITVRRKPRHIITIRILCHGSRAGDGEHPVAVKLPGYMYLITTAAVGPAGAGINNIRCGCNFAEDIAEVEFRPFQSDKAGKRNGRDQHNNHHHACQGFFQCFHQYSSFVLRLKRL